MCHVRKGDFQHSKHHVLAVAAPAGTPQPVLEKLNAAVNKIIATKDVRERLLQLGVESTYLNLEGFNKLFLADRELITRIVKETGITRD